MWRYFHLTHLSKRLISKLALIFLLFSFCYFCACSSEKNKNTRAFLKDSSERNSKASPNGSPSIKDDLNSIDTIVNALYESITFPEGEEPNLERFRHLFAPHASFIRITPEGVIKTDVEGFISSFKERIKSGKLKSFTEAEISRRTNVYAHIAQVFSVYEKIMNPHDRSSPVRGINSLQLYHDGKRWWISGITWEDEQGNNLIPDEYLHK
jgi:hypothetical protein